MELITSYHEMPDIRSEYTDPLEIEYFNEVPEIYMQAFDKKTARQIGQRDNWTCQNSGKRFQDGNLVDIAHYDHDKRNPKYNSPENGRVLGIEEHMIEHIQRFKDEPTERNAWSIGAIFRRILRGGSHTRRYYQSNPKQLEADRKNAKKILRDNRIDPDRLP